MGSAASESSYSPRPGAVFGLSPPESSPRSGRHNRRRDRPSWVRLTYTPCFDGHLWRKYGQKKIKDVEYPRRRSLPIMESPGLVLRFDSHGGHAGGDARMQQNGHCQQSKSPFMMLSFGSGSQTHDQVHHPAVVFRSDLDATAGGSSSSFPTEGLPAAPLPPANGDDNDDGDMLSALNSFAHDFDNEMHFGDHTYLPHNNSNYD